MNIAEFSAKYAISLGNLSYFFGVPHEKIREWVKSGECPIGVYGKIAKYDQLCKHIIQHFELMGPQESSLVKVMTQEEESRIRREYERLNANKINILENRIQILSFLLRELLSEEHNIELQFDT